MPGRVFLPALIAAALCFAPLLLQAETPCERALRALDQPAKIEFVDTPFQDVIAYISQRHGVPIKVLRETYDVAYVLPDQPVTRNFHGISLRSVLNLLLDPLKLDYRVTERGEIMIFAADKNAREQRPISKPQAAAAERHRQLLEKKVVSLEFVDTPLKDVISWLADEVGVRFVLDEEALDAVELQPDSPVSKNLKDMPLHRALTAFLYPYDLDVELRNEVFIIAKRNPLKPRRPIPEELEQAALKPVTIELFNPALNEALYECAEQANVSIYSDHRRMDRTRIAYDTKVIGPLPKMPLRDALQKILEPIGLQAKIIDEVLFITPQPEFVRGVTLPARTQRILDQKMKLETVDTLASEVFAYLSDQHGVSIRMTREAIAGGHLSGSYPLTWNLTDISLRSALNLILDPHGLDYYISGQGEILIVAREAGAARSPPKRPISAVQQAGNERNRQLLERKVVTIECADTPLRNVFGSLADDVGVPFVFDDGALAAVGLTVDTLVTRNLPNMPLHVAMTAFLFEHDLDVELRNEVFYVTKRDPRKPRRPIPPNLKEAARTPILLELRNPEFQDAVNACADQANVFITVDRRVERLGIKADTKVIGPLPKMPLRDALQKILEPIGLQAKVIDEVLFITTQELAKN